MFLPDQKKVRAAFDRAAPNYASAALLQHEVNLRLLARLDEVILHPHHILDVGAGVGNATHVLMHRYPDATVIALDIAPAMLLMARGNIPKLSNSQTHFICADAAHLPVRAEYFDLIYSNLTLQWCPDLDQALSELRRVLRSDGLFIFTTFGPDTLRELRSAWRAVDNYSHVNAFFDLHDIGDALTRNGFRGVIIDIEHFTLTYANVMSVMNDLKTIGAHNVTHGRPRGLTGRKRLESLIENYETLRINGRIPATYEVIYGHGWAGTRCELTNMPRTEPMFWAKSMRT